MRTITNELVERIANEADVAEQTVTRYIARLPQKPRVKKRIERALRKLKCTDLLVPELQTGTDG